MPAKSDEQLIKEAQERLTILLKDDPLTHPKNKRMTNLEMVHMGALIYGSLFVVYLFYRIVRFFMGYRGTNKLGSHSPKKRRREFKAVVPTVDMMDLPLIPKASASEMENGDDEIFKPLRRGPAEEDDRTTNAVPQISSSGTHAFHEDVDTQVRHVDETAERDPSKFEDVETNPGASHKDSK